jgi:hypothetical protein
MMLSSAARIRVHEDSDAAMDTGNPAAATSNSTSTTTTTVVSLHGLETPPPLPACSTPLTSLSSRVEELNFIQSAAFANANAAHANANGNGNGGVDIDSPSHELMQPRLLRFQSPPALSLGAPLHAAARR